MLTTWLTIALKRILAGMEKGGRTCSAGPVPTVVVRLKTKIIAIS
ncbi:MAG TPA: hypothetical protein VL087_02210 [Nitrospirota bacterium]|nr:hypothetical protein [Nitrospirota bacterium]